MPISRRQLLPTFAAASLSLTFPAYAEQQISERFLGLLLEVQSNDEETEFAREENEAKQIADLLGVIRGPMPKVAPSRRVLSSRASDLIIFCEITSRDVYTRKYDHPIWPKGASGITVGIGYDIGYVDDETLRNDWQAFISHDDIEVLVRVCGFTRDRAKDALHLVRQVKIPWEKAISQYKEILEPKYTALTEQSLENTASLTPDSLGALVSLTYNRGASFGIPQSQDPSGRYKEMRSIRRHMRDSNFAAIPSEIRSMTRLWEGKPNSAGLLRRRELEALLFELGLQS